MDLILEKYLILCTFPSDFPTHQPVMMEVLEKKKTVLKYVTKKKKNV